MMPIGIYCQAVIIIHWIEIEIIQIFTMSTGSLTESGTLLKDNGTTCGFELIKHETTV